LLPQIGAVARRWQRDTRVVVVLETGGIHESHPSLQLWRRLPVPIVTDEDGALRASTGIRNRPLAILVDPLGVVLMKGVVSTGAQLNSLMEERGIPLGGRRWQSLEPARASG